jgi:negative regulator of sigma E activity
VAVEVILRRSLSVKNKPVKTQKLPIVSDTPDNGMPVGWKRELSDWLLMVTTMGIAIWIFLTLVQLVFDLVIWLAVDRLSYPTFIPQGAKQ